MTKSKSVYVKWVTCPACHQTGAMYAEIQHAPSVDRYRCYLRVRHDKYQDGVSLGSTSCYLPESTFGSLYAESIPAVERKLAIPITSNTLPLKLRKSVAALAMGRHSVSERRRRRAWLAMSLPATIQVRIERVDFNESTRSAIHGLKALYKMVCKTGQLVIRTAVKELTEPERAWIAALLDGEGSIVKLHEADSLTSFARRIEINNSSLDLLNKVKETIGCGRVFLPKRSVRRNPCYVFQISRFDDCVALLTQIKEWLVVKADLAEHALSITDPEVLKNQVQEFVRTMSVTHRIEPSKADSTNLDKNPSRA